MSVHPKIPEDGNPSIDRQNHLALPHRREAGRRWDGCGLQGEDAFLGRFVALKFLPEDVAQDPQGLNDPSSMEYLPHYIFGVKPSLSSAASADGRSMVKQLT